jgi:hypothetical protein
MKRYVLGVKRNLGHRRIGFTQIHCSGGVCAVVGAGGEGDHGVVGGCCMGGRHFVYTRLDLIHALFDRRQAGSV